MRRILAGVLAVGCILSAGMAEAARYSVLYNFTGGSDGMAPAYALTRDAAGNLYGTTVSGGASNQGTIFQLSPAGTKTVLYSFDFARDGISKPIYGVVEDGAGNFYGVAGGSMNVCGAYPYQSDCNAIYELSAGGTLSLLHQFTGDSGGGVLGGGLLLDTALNLYGTADYGSPYGLDFKIAPDGTETVLYSFQGGLTDGAYPDGTLVRDKAGTLYGTTNSGGGGAGSSAGYGTVYKITKSGVESVIYAFQSGADGAYPHGVIRDDAGNLYGTTPIGGTGSCSFNCGMVYEIAAGGTKSILYTFQGPYVAGADGDDPVSVLIDKRGDLYGTTLYGGNDHCYRRGCGTVFKLAPDGTETKLYAFNKTTGFEPAGGVVQDAQSNLYGAVPYGGPDGGGMIYTLRK